MRAKVIAQTMLSAEYLSLSREFGFEWENSRDATDPQLLSEFAGRLCYKSWSKPNPATATNEGYIESLKEHKHFSVLEHGSVSFYFDGISRNLTHELVRHRHFSFSQVSQRYVDDSESNVVTPDVVWDLGSPEILALAEHLENGKKLYGAVRDELKARGLPKKKAQQAARFILPGSTETAIVVSGNHRSWREFVDKRYSEYADPEIRDLAGLVLAELREIAPAIYSDFPEKDFSAPKVPEYAGKHRA